jgi:hypothetical protein
LRVVASEDTWNDDNNQNLTHGTDVKLGVSGSSNYNVDLGTCCTGVKNGRAYVTFDLSSLPAGATIQSATLQLSGGPTTIGGSPVTARRVTSAWSEATMTTSNRPNNAGGGAAVTGSATNVSGTMVLTFNVASDVTGRATNLLNGWELRANGNTGSWWYSSEWATATQRPTLTVVYQ